MNQSVRKIDTEKEFVESIHYLIFKLNECDYGFACRIKHCK